MPAKRVVRYEEFSDHSKGLIEKYGLSTAVPPKLIVDLGPKFAYKIHMTYLQTLLSLGVVIHRITRAVR